MAWKAINTGLAGDALTVYDVAVEWQTMGGIKAEMVAWAATKGGLFRSVGLESWTQISLPDPGSGVPVPYSLSCPKYQGDTVYVLGEVDGVGVWVMLTEDAGDSWSYRALGREGEWLPIGVGANDGVYALALSPDERYLYVGGAFTSIGGIAANYIAKYDRVDDMWEAMGNLDDWVMAIAVNDAGTVFIGGYFVQDGATVLNYVAYWGGVTWSAMAGGMNSGVLALAVSPSGTLHAGGHFDEAGGHNVDYIAKWLGGGWQSLGIAWDAGPPYQGGQGPDNDVYDIAFDSQGDLYCVGQFTYLSYPADHCWHIAMWDGLWWHDIAPLTYCDWTYSVIVDNNDSVYVGGGSSDIYGDPLQGIIKWEGGHGWSQVGESFYTYGIKDINALRVHAGDNTLYAAGAFIENAAQTRDFGKVASWDGGSWDDMDMGFDYYRAMALAVADDCVYCGGLFTENYDRDVMLNYLAQWELSVVEIPDVGYPHLMDVDIDGEYVYVSVLRSGYPVVLRVRANLASDITVYAPGSGTWAGVACDWYDADKLWVFGDLGVSSKVRRSDDAGVSTSDKTDSGWLELEIVSAIVPDLRSVGELAATLATAQDAWRSTDDANSWSKQGNTPFAARCLARELLKSYKLWIGRPTAGSNSLQRSGDRGSSWKTDSPTSTAGINTIETVVR